MLHNPEYYQEMFAGQKKKKSIGIWKCVAAFIINFFQSSLLKSTFNNTASSQYQVLSSTTIIETVKKET